MAEQNKAPDNTAGKQNDPRLGQDQESLQTSGDRPAERGGVGPGDTATKGPKGGAAKDAGDQGNVAGDTATEGPKDNAGSETASTGKTRGTHGAYRGGGTATTKGGTGGQSAS